MFNNDENGFMEFAVWISNHKEQHGKDKVIPGMDLVLVNPHHVKKSIL